MTIWFIALKVKVKLFAALNTSIPNNPSNTTPPNNESANTEETRRLRFENLILQSKVETLEAENKSLKEVSKSESESESESEDMSNINARLSSSYHHATVTLASYTNSFYAPFRILALFR